MARITISHQMVSVVMVMQRHQALHQRVDHLQFNFRLENREKDQHQNYLEMNCAKFVIRKQLDFIIMFYHVKLAR